MEAEQEERSLGFMISCIRDCIPNARNERIQKGLEAAIRTLEWLQKGESVIRMLVALRRERPSTFRTMAELLRVFPYAQPEDIRRVA